MVNFDECFHRIFGDGKRFSVIYRKPNSTPERTREFDSPRALCSWLDNNFHGNDNLLLEKLIDHRNDVKIRCIHDAIPYASSLAL